LGATPRNRARRLPTPRRPIGKPQFAVRVHDVKLNLKAAAGRLIGGSFARRYRVPPVMEPAKLMILAPELPPILDLKNAEPKFGHETGRGHERSPVLKMPERRTSGLAVLPAGAWRSFLRLSVVYQNQSAFFCALVMSTIRSQITRIRHSPRYRDIDSVFI
jgi:hypothetical protein